jgi:hypothetical protein
LQLKEKGRGVEPRSEMICKELKKILYPCGVVVPVIEDDLDEVEVRVEVEIDRPDKRQKEQK